MLLDWIRDNLYGISPTSFCVVLLTLIVTIVYYASSYRNLPPGPTGLPILGYWPFLDPKTCYLQMDELKKKYGDFCSISCTGRLYICLGSFKAVREAHIAKSDCFGGRFEDFNLLTAIFGAGVGFVNGESWKVLRKFFLQSFKQRGILTAKEGVSASLCDSIGSTLATLRTKEMGEPVDILAILTESCTTVLRLTLFGEEGVSQERIVEINALYGSILECMTATNMLLIGNVARYLILPFTSGYRQFKRDQPLIEDIYYKIIDEHKSTYNEEHIRDVIDEYIKERNERSAKGDPAVRHFTDTALMSSLVQIVGDGVLTVAAFIALFIKILLEHPEEQDKIYREVVEVVGVDRQPTVEDKSRLTYTNAFILEALRTADFFPFFPSMQCTKETTIRGYRIPKGTITLINTWSAHHDPEVYEEPERFNPSRFLETEGKRRPELPISFGVGKRACVGEGFAMLQVFLFLTSLIQNFHVRMQDDADENSYQQFFTGKIKIMVEPRS